MLKDEVTIRKCAYESAPGAKATGSVLKDSSGHLHIFEHIVQSKLTRNTIELFRDRGRKPTEKVSEALGSSIEFLPQMCELRVADEVMPSTAHLKHNPPFSPALELMIRQGPGSLFRLG